MWTPAARTELARENLPYASSLTDTEWALIAPLLPEPSRIGRPWRWPLRAILDGIQYVLRTGCAWRQLPLDPHPELVEGSTLVHRSPLVPAPVEGRCVRAPRPRPHHG